MGGGEEGKGRGREAWVRWRRAGGETNKIGSN